MKLQANALYLAIKSLGKLPKTLQIERLRTCTDLATGRQQKKREVEKYAVVRVLLDGSTVTVDYSRLRAWVRTLGTAVIDLQIECGLLCGNYPAGDFVLFDLDATPAAEIDLMAVVQRR